MSKQPNILKSGILTAEVDLDISSLLQKISELENMVDRIANRLAAFDEQGREKFPAWLTAEETAEFLRTDTTTIYRRVAAGKLPVSPHGKPWRISRDALFEMARESRKRRDAS